MKDGHVVSRTLTIKALFDQEWKDEKTNEWMNEWMKGWMNEWMNEWMHIIVYWWLKLAMMETIMSDIMNSMSRKTTFKNRSFVYLNGFI